MPKIKSKISKEELNKLPIEVFKGRIHVVDTPEEADKAVNYLMEQDYIGFDTETKPSFVKGENHVVALMQLSNKTDSFLFRLNMIGIPQNLEELIASQKVRKIGLSTKDDFRALKKIKKDLKPANFIELQNYAPQFGIEEKSLSKMYAILFNKRISKGQRLSNWEADPLNSKQQQYAALDAYATRRIYTELEKMRANGYLQKEAAKKKKGLTNSAKKAETSPQAATKAKRPTRKQADATESQTQSPTLEETTK